MIDPKDGGWRSRKFALTVFAMLLITGLGIAAGQWPAMGANLPVTIGGLITVLALFFGANTAHTLTVAKVMTSSVGAVNGVARQLSQTGEQEESPEPGK